MFSRTSQTKQQEVYHAFLSYSTDPDYWLVRRTETFLESFHRQIPEDVASQVKPMSICVDGADFQLATDRQREQSSAQDDVRRLIFDNLNSLA